MSADVYPVPDAFAANARIRRDDYHVARQQLLQFALAFAPLLRLPLRFPLRLVAFAFLRLRAHRVGTRQIELFSARGVRSTGRGSARSAPARRPRTSR